MILSTVPIPIPLLFLLFLTPIATPLPVLNPLESLLFTKRLTDIQTNTIKSFRSIIHDDNKKSPANAATTRHLTLIFPGAGGPDAFTRELHDALLSYDEKTFVFDWSDDRGSVLTAAFDSEAVGEAVASCLPTTFPRLVSLHCVGISVGAFAANLCAARTKVGHSRLTLLDPFCSRSVWGGGYGKRYFGAEGVDFAVQYLNTDDFVPSTNDALPFCHCVDVTGARERDAFVLPEGESMHCWPLVYYARYGLRDEKEGIDSLPQYPRHGEDGVPVKGTIVFK